MTFMYFSEIHKIRPRVNFEVVKFPDLVKKKQLNLIYLTFGLIINGPVWVKNL